MSLGLQATKRRIVSVNSTKKITKAMQLVATAKLKTMKRNLEATYEYANEISILMNSLMEKMSLADFKEVFKVSSKQNDSTVYLIISSSLGLCGGYNYNLFKQLIPQINKEKDLLVCIGSKAVSFFKGRGYHVDDSQEHMANNFDYSHVDNVSKYLLYLYTSGKCNKIKIGYTHYKNQISFIPMVEDLFPFSKVDNKTSNLTNKEKDMIVEPNPIVVVKKLLPLYLKSIIYSRINESTTSEYASRRNAMEAATDNAEEIVTKLQIEFNKARQAAITQEITEVVGGASAS